MKKRRVPAHGLERRRYLLLDARIVEDVQNAELTLGIVNKYTGNPLFSEDKPWEMRFDNLYANVIYDDEEQLYKCWYSPFASDAAEPATVTTTPVFDGKATLRVSADIADGGTLVVRVLGEERQVLAESQPLGGTVSDADVRWLDGVSLHAIKTKRARLQFAFQEATVYSFSVKARE